MEGPANDRDAARAPPTRHDLVLRRPVRFLIRQEQGRRFYCPHPNQCGGRLLHLCDSRPGSSAPLQALEALEHVVAAPRHTSPGLLSVQVPLSPAALPPPQVQIVARSRHALPWSRPLPRSQLPIARKGRNRLFIRVAAHKSFAGLGLAGRHRRVLPIVRRRRKGGDLPPERPRVLLYRRGDHPRTQARRGVARVPVPLLARTGHAPPVAKAAIELWIRAHNHQPCLAGFKPAAVAAAAAAHHDVLEGIAGEDSAWITCIHRTLPNPAAFRILSNFVLSAAHVWHPYRRSLALTAWYNTLKDIPLAGWGDEAPEVLDLAVSYSADRHRDPGGIPALVVCAFEQGYYRLVSFYIYRELRGMNAPLKLNPRPGHRWQVQRTLREWVRTGSLDAWFYLDGNNEIRERDDAARPFSASNDRWRVPIVVRIID